MSNPRRRLERQRMREMMRANKPSSFDQEGLLASGELTASVVETLTNVVASGRAKMAVTIVLDQHIMQVGMWEGDAVVVHAYDMNDDLSMQLLCAAAADRGIGREELVDFLNSQMDAAIRCGANQTPLSIIEWRPGEGPPPSGSTASG